MWGAPRGDPANTGVTGTPGHDPGASEAWFAEYEGEGRQFQTLSHHFVPLVGADSVFTVAHSSAVDPPEYGLSLYSFSKADGRRNWRQQLFLNEGMEHRSIVEGHYRVWLGADALYLARAAGQSYDLTLTKHSPADGSVLWEQTYPEPANGFRGPVVADGTIYVEKGERLYAYSTDDGSQRWRSEEYSTHGFSPGVGEDTVVAFGKPPEFGVEENTVYGFSVDDGTTQWTQTVPETGNTAIAPTIVGDTVYVPTGGTLTANRGSSELYALSLTDGSVQWQFTPGDETVGGAGAVAATASTVYLTVSTRQPWRLESEYAGYNVYALNADDGSIRWKQLVGEIPDLIAPPVVSDRYVYVVHNPDRTRSEPGEFGVVLDRDLGETAGSFTHSGRPTLIGLGEDALYLQDRSGVRCYR